MKLVPFSGIQKSNSALKKSMRKIHVNTTYWKFTHPCETCGKEGGVIAGIPTELDMIIPLTAEEHERVAQKAFYIGMDFKIRCNGGASHIAVGLKPGAPNFYVSDTPGYKQGYYIEGESVEKALHKFIPFLKEATNLPNKLGWPNG